jgi:hypothetical protein
VTEFLKAALLGLGLMALVAAVVIAIAGVAAALTGPNPLVKECADRGGTLITDRYYQQHCVKPV